MAACSNCGKNLSCGCQRRTASNKKSVCSNCLKSYENSLKADSKAETVKELSSYKTLEKFIKK